MAHESQYPAEVAAAEDASLPQPLAAAEAELVQLRRASLGMQGHPDQDAIGVGLSGGGVRSATFALGIFQALARHDQLRKIDYLSTVSGGGFFGGFYGTLLRRKELGLKSHNDVRDVLLEQHGKVDAIRYLRENGRYLAPGGSDDLLLGAATLFRNWLAVHLLFLSAAFTPFLSALVGFRLVYRVYKPTTPTDIDFLALLHFTSGTYSIALSPWVFGSALLSVLWVTPLIWSYWTIGRSVPMFVGTALRPIAYAVWTVLPFVAIAAVGVLMSRPATQPLAWLGTLLAGISCQALATGLIAMSRGPRWAPRFVCLAWIAWVGLFLGLGAYASTSHALWLGTYVWMWIMIASALGSLAGVSWNGIGQEDGVEELNFDNLGRYELSNALKNALLATGAVLALGLIDTIARSVPSTIHEQVGRYGGGIAGAMAVIGAVLRRVWPRLVALRANHGKRMSLPTSWLTTTLGVSVVVVTLIAVDLLAIVVRGHTRGATCGWVVLCSGLFCVLLGLSRNLLNASSQLPLYSARLIRAYLGASNKRRRSTEATVARADEAAPSAASRVMDGDDMPAAQYWGWHERNEALNSAYALGAPLHLVNVTINETVDGRSQLEQRDRKGLGLAVGPCAFSAGVKHHFVFRDGVFPKQGFKVFRFSDRDTAVKQDERPAARLTHFKALHDKAHFPLDHLSLGQWLGISGAAFSTGLGAQTNLGLSILAAWSNVRLGYWWRPGTVPRLSWPHRLLAMFWVQTYLFRELLARFPGTARSLWYLSDGGHFENLGGYELIRRRVPFILLIDAEADPDYRFEGLANLVRKARIDFGADITFLDRTEVPGARTANDTSPCTGLEQLRRGVWTQTDAQGAPVLESETRTGLSRAHSALAKVTYSDDTESWLLYVKPSLIGGEPQDVQHYHSLHPDFPHETTTDQFFDEAQWESYRKLGELIGERLLTNHGILRRVLDRTLLRPRTVSGVAPAPAPRAVDEVVSAKR